MPWYLIKQWIRLYGAVQLSTGIALSLPFHIPFPSPLPNLVLLTLCLNNFIIQH